jgi:hypothetical protein
MSQLPTRELRHSTNPRMLPVIIPEPSNSRFPVALEKYDVKRLSGRFVEVAQAMGAYSERITEPQEIVPTLTRGLAAGDGVGIPHSG